jgi:sodium transport system permease protein
VLSRPNTRSFTPMKDLRTSASRRGRLDWRQVGILYGREMRSSLREKTIVINSILLPLFLYPFILWAGFTGLLFVRGQTEGLVSRVVVRGWPKGHSALRRILERDEQIQFSSPRGALAEEDRLIQEGKLEARLEFLPAPDTVGRLTNNFQAHLTYNESKERSTMARQRIAAAIQQYREDWLKREAHTYGVQAADWQVFALATQNVASSKQMGTFLLGLMLPVLFVVMVAMGCFYPAVDATAGERERNTWETLMSTAASRVSIVTAKYLHVVTLGGLAGVLNLFAMALTVKPIFAPLLAEAGETFDFRVPLVALPVMVLAAVLLAGFVAAGMMIFAAFARTFKEGQAMIMPFYLIVLLPVMFLQVPGLKLTLPLAFLPVVNVTMMIRETISGTFHWLPMAATLVVSLAMIAGCVRLAAFILQFEDVVLGSYEGGLKRFLRARVWRWSKPAAAAPEVTP